MLLISNIQHNLLRKRDLYFATKLLVMRNSVKIYGRQLIIILLFFPGSLYSQERNIQENSETRTHLDNNLKWGPCPEFMPEGCNIAVLHGDPSEKNVDIFFKVSENTAIPNHWHSSAERMILVAGELEITYEGEEPKLLKEGSYAYGPAEKPHSARCLDSGPCVLFIAFEEPLDAFEVAVKD